MDRTPGGLDLSDPPVRVLRQGTPNKCDVRVHRIGDELLLVKDFGRKSRVYRSLLGVLTTWHEARVLRRLRGLPGVPQLRGRPSRCSVAMSYVPCRRARSRNPQIADRAAFAERLRDIVRKMHRRGVVHFDLKHRSNLMVTEEGRPFVIDFESAFYFGRGLLGRLLVKFLGRVDWLAVSNWIRRICPEQLTPAERRLAAEARRHRGFRAAANLRDALARIFSGPNRPVADGP
ncbi:MAG: phosphotransferase [Planctomycetota bacterium]